MLFKEEDVVTTLSSFRLFWRGSYHVTSVLPNVATELFHLSQEVPNRKVRKIVSLEVETITDIFWYLSPCLRFKDLDLQTSE